MNFVYGPVPSRRLGISLGIDIVPPSTCTFDCVYCQLGKTLHKVNHWAGIKFPDTEEIMRTLKLHPQKYDKVDFITISGSGEPTLNPQLGEIAKRIRALTNLPLVLITNSSLLTYETVLDSAKKFDIVIPSLDAGDIRTLKMINRPADGFNIGEIAGAIRKLRQESKSEIWLEVMLAKGRITNASSESITNISKKISEIHPNLVYLNSPVRPPVEEYVKPLTEDEMEKIKLSMMTKITEDIDIEVVPRLSFSKYQLLKKDDLSKEISRVLSIRPCTIQDISNMTGGNLSEIGKYMGSMLDAGRITKIISNNETYYLSQLEGPD